jgi:choline/glycine/proline betaine transport protein
VVYYKWGDIVLGANQQDTTPDLDDSTWTTAMFTSVSMGLALLFFGVSEPIYNMEAALEDSLPYNAASQHGVFMTFYHFGLHTWAPFVLGGMLIGLAHYRHGFPLTVRSAFNECKPHAKSLKWQRSHSADRWR